MYTEIKSNATTSRTEEKQRHPQDYKTSAISLAFTPYHHTSSKKPLIAICGILAINTTVTTMDFLVIGIEFIACMYATANS